jgi:PAS domain S-box-containing protein
MSSADRDILRAQTREHGRTLAETVAYRKDGTPFDVELIHVAMRDEHGRLTGYVAINRNISEHKRALEQLAYHASLLENLHDAVIATDEKFVVTAWNKGADELYGWTADEALGRPAHEMVRAQHSDAGLADALRQLNETGSRRAETVVLHRDGTPVPIEAVTIALRDERGDITGYLGINRDITERRHAEEQRARAEEKLREVRETERRRIARDLHDEALQELTHALALAQGARAGATEPAENDALLSALKRVGQQLRGAIYDLRLEDQESRPFPDRLAALVALGRPIAVGRRVQLDRAKELPGDPFGRVGTELLRIVGEALTNADRHAGARNIRVRTWTSGRRLFVEVADDGRGFDPDEEPGAHEGSGLRGMRERAGLIGADLEIRSGPGAGTTVRVALSLAGDTGPLQPVRVLLVEDHVAVREAIAATLAREADFEVTGEAASLAEARRMLDHVDVAVVDLRVADGYGWDLIGELRAANPEAQALVLTASVDRADIARAIESGAAGVLNKAAALDKVVEAVRRLRAGEALLPMTEVVELLHFAGRRRRQEHDDRRAISRLTPREREILQALARGLDSQHIAERLHITVRTERNHVSSILAKLGVHSRLQALVFAMRYQLVEIP